MKYKLLSRIPLVTLLGLCMVFKFDPIRAQDEIEVLVTSLSWRYDSAAIAVGLGEWYGSAPRGNQLLASCRGHSDIDILSVPTLQQSTIARSTTACSPSVVDYNPDGTHLLVASGDLFENWDVNTQTREGGVLLEGFAQSTSWSPTGELALLTEIAIVQITSAGLYPSIGGFLKPRSGWDGTLIFSAWSPDGERVATSSSNGHIYVWNVQDSDRLTTFTAHTCAVKRLAWSPDGMQIVSGDDCGSMWIWDTQTGQPIRQLVGHQGIVYAVDWSPDGSQIASASGDGTIRIWNPATGDSHVIASGSIFSAVAYSPDGLQLAYGGEVSDPDHLSTAIYLWQQWNGLTNNRTNDGFDIPVTQQP